jgi:hypothetical protein
MWPLILMITLSLSSSTTVWIYAIGMSMMATSRCSFVSTIKVSNTESVDTVGELALSLLMKSLC